MYEVVYGVVPSWSAVRVSEWYKVNQHSLAGAHIEVSAVVPESEFTTLEYRLNYGWPTEYPVDYTDRDLSAVEAMSLGGIGAKGRVLSSRTGTGLVAFFHDDLVIHDSNWVQRVLDFFNAHPSCGLVGFHGAMGLGHEDIYKIPYQLPQLARVSPLSNMTDAETHGSRVDEPHRVATLDGFALIFSLPAYIEMGGWEACLADGLYFHEYDLWATARMAELGREVWMLPISCTHQGGQTEVGMAERYEAMCKARGFQSSKELYDKAHAIVYERFRGVLPLRY